MDGCVKTEKLWIIRSLALAVSLFGCGQSAQVTPSDPISAAENSGATQVVATTSVLCDWSSHRTD